jgi:uncharacterized YigZ family protein
MMIIENECEGRYEEKRSVFIGKAWYITSADQAEEILSSVRKRYHDARHNCFAYILENGEMRMSDDGEPSGTAGKPILSVIQNRGYVNVLVTVTRYFGGTLLGAGGLVRAYTKACENALNESGSMDVTSGIRYELSYPYEYHGRIVRILNEKGAMTEECEYGADVRCVFLIDAEMRRGICDEIKEISAGRIKPVEKEKVRYAIDGKKILELGEDGSIMRKF